MTPILHIITREAWATALEQGAYRAPSLADEGFIHTSTAEQVLGVANTFYAGLTDLAILVIDSALVEAEIKYEAPSGDGPAPAPGLFPHIYGALNLNAVVKVVDFPLGADGAFSLPVI